MCTCLKRITFNLSRIWGLELRLGVGTVVNLLRFTRCRGKGENQMGNWCKSRRSGFVLHYVLHTGPFVCWPRPLRGVVSAVFDIRLACSYQFLWCWCCKSALMSQPKLAQTSTAANAFIHSFILQSCHVVWSQIIQTLVLNNACVKVVRFTTPLQVWPHCHPLRRLVVCTPRKTLPLWTSSLSTRLLSCVACSIPYSLLAS